MKVKKKTGTAEMFNSKKLCDSMTMVGASNHLAKQICGIVQESVDSGTSSEQIFETTSRYLAEYNPGMAALYRLERGLAALGPSGFIFEQYVEAIMKVMGYRTETNVYLDGEAVTHEIDVWAEKGNTVFIVEAKYRNDFKTKTHINQIMYADSRLEDIRRRAVRNGDHREYYMWVITNTRFTDNAINYIRYRDIQLLGWDYPKYINLMKIVYEKKLYPVTVLPSINNKIMQHFSNEHIILVRQLVDYTTDDFMEKCKVDEATAARLLIEVKELMEE